MKYPDSFPQPSVEFSLNVEANLGRTLFDAGNSRQRRGEQTFTGVGSLTFSMKTRDYGNFVDWMTTYGYEWFDLVIPNEQSGDSVATKIGVRLMGAIEVTSRGFDYMSCSVMARMSIYEIAPVDSQWIIAGHPASPSLSVVIAGNPASPSVDYVLSGSPAAPTASYLAP